jgi:hypothetical protein
MIALSILIIGLLVILILAGLEAVGELADVYDEDRYE